MARPPAAAGDVAHVHLLDLGPDIRHEDVDHLTYDDATAQLLAVKGGHVFAYGVAGGPAGGASLRWMYPLQEGPRVVALRPSLDNRTLAVQRSAALLELVDLATGLCSVYSVHRGAGSILAFFFTDAPDTDCVVVTTRAVELTQFAGRRQGLRCRERIRSANAWALYTHETRMLLVGSAAPPHSTLAAWQFASPGIVHLPLFELQGPLLASAAVRQFLPGGPQGAYAAPPQPPAPAPAQRAPPLPTSTPPSGDAGGLLSAAGGPAPDAASRPPPGPGQAGAHRGLGPDRLWLLKMYGRVYLAHADPAWRRLELYRFYTDTLILQHAYELIAPRVQLSVVDNALLVHYPETGVVMLFDVAASQNAPVTSPLPLRRLTLLPPALAAAVGLEQAPQGQEGGDAGAGDAESSSSDDAAAAAAAPAGGASGGLSRCGSRTLVAAGSVAALSAEADAAAPASGDVYESSDVLHAPTWSYFMPCIVLDKATKSIGRLQLDLQAIADSAEDWPVLVSFLLRRRALHPTAPLAVSPRALLMAIARGALQERLPLAQLRDIFDLLLQAYADALSRAAAPHAAGGSYGGAPAGGAGLLDVPAVAVITPNELAAELFQWAHDEEVVDALDLQAAVGEFRAAADAVGVAPPSYLELLGVDLLLQQEQHYQAVQLLYSQPGCGSAALAQHLLEVASCKDGAPAAAGGGGGGGGLRPGGAPAGQQQAAAGAGGQPLAACFDPSPGSAMALELALDVMARQSAPELRPASAAGTQGSAAAAGAGAAARASTSALVRQLLSMGQVLPAVRLTRTAGGVGAVGVPASAFLAAAGASGDAGVFAAAYRVTRPHVVDAWPDYASALAHFCGGSGGGAAAAAAAPRPPIELAQNG